MLHIFFPETNLISVAHFLALKVPQMNITLELLLNANQYWTTHMNQEKHATFVYICGENACRHQTSVVLVCNNLILSVVKTNGC